MPDGGVPGVQIVGLLGLGPRADGDSTLPALSADGLVVGFESLATNLVHGDDNGAKDVFVHE